MTNASQDPAEPAVTGTRPETEQRREERVDLTLLGRFMRPNRHEYPCKMSNITTDGAAISSPVGVEEGERIVAYFDYLGGLEGTVVRVIEGGFAMQFKITAHKREKLAAQLVSLIDRSTVSGLERRHERYAVATQRTKPVVLDSGETFECEIADISISGASLRTGMRPAIGSDLTLGRLRGRVVRHDQQGIGVQFTGIGASEALRRHFG
jgi:hypothetical protein